MNWAVIGVGISLAGLMCAQTALLIGYLLRVENRLTTNQIRHENLTGRVERIENEISQVTRLKAAKSNGL